MADHRLTVFVAALALGGAGARAGDAAGRDAAVRLYLPRTVRVDGDQLRLAQLGVLLCAEPDLEARARAVPMGRAPWPREQLVIDRTTILSQLAAAGIARQLVRFSGAEKVVVVRDEKTLSPEKLLAEAEAFLQKHFPAGEGIFEVLRKPQEIVVSGGGEVQCACELAPDAPANRVKVVLRLRRDGKQLGLREVLYRRMYPVRSAVVTEPIAAGAALTKENVEIQTAYAEQPGPADWKPPYGLLATRRLMPGTVLRPGMTADKRPEILIRRDQTVRMRIEGPGFVVTCVGLALEQGQAGEYIKVRNVDSGQVVTARVAFDGTVEPVFKR